MGDPPGTASGSNVTTPAPLHVANFKYTAIDLDRPLNCLFAKGKACTATTWGTAKARLGLDAFGLTWQAYERVDSVDCDSWCDPEPQDAHLSDEARMRALAARYQFGSWDEFHEQYARAHLFNHSCTTAGWRMTVRQFLEHYFNKALAHHAGRDGCRPPRAPPLEGDLLEYLVRGLSVMHLRTVGW